ncbi:hypothetical protein Tco_0001142 [Tanacetum coccineum]
MGNCSCFFPLWEMGKLLWEDWGGFWGNVRENFGKVLEEICVLGGKFFVLIFVGWESLSEKVGIGESGDFVGKFLMGGGAGKRESMIREENGGWWERRMEKLWWSWGLSWLVVKSGLGCVGGLVGGVERVVRMWEQVIGGPEGGVVGQVGVVLKMVDTLAWGSMGGAICPLERVMASGMLGSGYAGLGLRVWGGGGGHYWISYSQHSLVRAFSS